jgi:hypothetical protein
MGIGIQAPCHSERSEESRGITNEILRCAQDDSYGLNKKTRYVAAAGFMAGEN